MRRLIRSWVSERLAAWVVCCSLRPRTTLAIIVLASLLAAAGSWHYGRIDGDLERLIQPGAEQAWYAHDLEFKAAFPDLQQTALVVIDGRDRLAVTTLARELASALRNDPAIAVVLAPELDPFFERKRLYYLEPDRLGTWLTAIAFDPSRLDDLLAGGARTSADRHLVTLLLKGSSKGDSSLPHGPLIDRVRGHIEAHSADGVRARLTGEIVLEHEEIGMALEGIALAGTVSLLLLALILRYGVRSWRIGLAIFALLVSGTALTLGWATLAVGTFNTLALMFVVMFFGLGVDFAVHFSLRVREAQNDGDPVAAAAEAAREIGPALALCMLTSSIAFLAFAPTGYRGLAELGIISAGGMVIAFVLTLSLIPALFGWLGAPALVAPPMRPPAPARLPSLPIAIGALLLALVAGYFAKDLRFDYSVLALRDSDTEAMSTLLDLQQAQFTTDYSIAVIAEPDAVESLRAALEARPEVGRVRSPSDWIPADQDSTRETLAETATAFGELSESSGLDRLQTMLRAEPFTVDDLPEDLRRTLITADGRHLIRVEPSSPLTDRAATTAFIEAVAAVSPNYAGRAVVEWGVGNVVVTAFTQAATLALVAIVILMVLYFHSLLLPLLVLLPITLSLLLTFAIAQLSGLTLNMANILVVPLIFGLGVDTGIHVVHRYTAAGSVEGVFTSSTARAVVISGLTTIGTFFALSFSPHHGAASVGLLLAIAIGLMLAVTFVLLPALLRLTGSRSHGG